MNREDIIRMAREAGFEVLLPSEEVFGRGGVYTGSDDEISKYLERFADLVASAEREACAKVCELIDMESFGVLPVRAVMIANDCAEAIRARGNIKQFEPCPFIECDCDGNHPLNQPAIRVRGQA